MSNGKYLTGNDNKRDVGHPMQLAAKVSNTKKNNKKKRWQNFRITTKWQMRPTSGKL